MRGKSLSYITPNIGVPLFLVMSTQVQAIAIRGTTPLLVARLWAQHGAMCPSTHTVHLLKARRVLRLTLGVLNHASRLVHEVTLAPRRGSASLNIPRILHYIVNYDGTIPGHQHALELSGTSLVHLLRP